MPEIAYLDFDIEIERAAPGYRVAVKSPAGQSAGSFEPPFSDLELENFLLKLGQSRRVMRRIDAPATEAAKVFGARLFEAAFAGDARACLRSSLDEAGRQGKGLRIRLRLNNAPELAELPWEFLYHPAVNRFLALSIDTPVVRFLDLPEAIRPLAVVPPLRVLALIASPRDQAPIDAEREWRRLREALGELEQRGLVQLERLEQPSLAALQRTLRRGAYHILHFMGHGGFDQGKQDGMLLLEDDDGLSYRISGEDLGMLLHDQRTLRLVLLNACEGARAARADPFAGAAQSLVQQGVPAVIAMQFEVSDEAAIALAREFYSALADGYPVDAGLAEARKALFAAGGGVEWATPVLYLRAPDGHIFSIEELSSLPNDRRSLIIPPEPTLAAERHLDAALPDQVVVNQTIELVAMIRHTDSAGLRALLAGQQSDFEAQPEDVRSQLFNLDFPRDARGNPAPLELTIAIETSDFRTPTPQQKIRLEPDADTEPIIFLLTPLKSGDLRLLLHVYVNRDLLLASGFLKVNGVSQLAEGFRPLKRLISLSLGTFGIGQLPANAPAAQRPPRAPETQSMRLPATVPAPQAAFDPQLAPRRSASWIARLAPILAALVVLIGVGLTYTSAFRSSANPGTAATRPPPASATSAPAPTNPPRSYNDWAGLQAPLATITTTTQLNTVAVSPDSQLIAAGGLDNIIYIWDLATRVRVREMQQSTQSDDTVSRLAFSPNSALLASVYAGNDILLWNVADGTIARQLHGTDPHTDIVLAIAFSPDGTLLASGSLDKTIKIWRVADGTLLRTLRGHINGVTSVAFSPDSRTLISGAFENVSAPHDTQVRLWQVSDGALLRSFDGAADGIMSVAFSHDGKTIAAGSWDNYGYLWRVADGVLLGRLDGNLVNGIYALAFSPDDSVVATGGGDAFVRLFAVAGARQIFASQPPGLQTTQGWVTDVAFTPDGQRLLTSSYDMTIRIWGFAP